MLAPVATVPRTPEIPPTCSHMKALNLYQQGYQGSRDLVCVGTG